MNKKFFRVMFILITIFLVLGVIDVVRIASESHEKRENASGLILSNYEGENMDNGQKSDIGHSVKREIVVAGTVVPQKTVYPDFDLEHLSIVGRTEVEDDSSGIESVGESAEDSVRTERAEPDVETDGEFDGESDESDSDTMSELVEPEPIGEAELEGQLGEYSGYAEDGYGDGYTDESEVGLTYLGDWYITAYCPCEICCGAYSSGYTASGTLATAGRTVACNVLPIGTQVMIDGCIYTVEDTGWSPYDAWIDIFFDSHDQASAYGLQIREVYLVE